MQKRVQCEVGIITGYLNHRNKINKKMYTVNMYVTHSIPQQPFLINRGGFINPV